MTDNVQQNPTADPATSKSLADFVASDEQRPFAEAFPAPTLIKMAVLVALFAALNWWQFSPLVSRWLHDENWTFGFVIPLFSLYLLYARWDEFMSARRHIAVTGLPLMILSIAAIVISFAFIHNTWLCNLGMVALLLSMIIYLGGWQIAKLGWLPVLFLAFAMPLPEMLYTKIAVPLQELAAQVSTITLEAVQVDIDRTASALTMTSIGGNVHHVTVAEACSGVRSLLAFMAMGVAWAYLEQRPIWQRVIIVLSAAPIAIFCNVIRVTITCTMFVIDKPELGEGFMHKFAGMVMLAPALGMFWLLSKLLESIFVEVEEDEETSDPDVADEEKA